MCESLNVDGVHLPVYKHDHPVDYCPSCNKNQDVDGIVRADFGNHPEVREVEEATENRCERCGHTWINLSRPTPDDYPNSNLNRFARRDVKQLVRELTEDRITVARRFIARLGRKVLYPLGFLLLCVAQLIELIDVEATTDE
jgi:hypothetical protein